MTHRHAFCFCDLDLDPKILINNVTYNSEDVPAW